MNKDILKRAVELADGFDLVETMVKVNVKFISSEHLFFMLDDPRLADMVAAQLVRHVDALDRAAFHCEPTSGIVCEVARHYPFAHKALEVAEGPDRTENTITAIVESNVLSTGEVK